MGVQVGGLASLQFAVGERNEATKQALKHESATKTFVDNLLSELAQLRRENAEKTMAAEVIAKEIRRLQPLEQELMSKDRMPLQKHASKVVEAKKILVAFDKTSTRYCREIPCTSDADCEKRCCDTGCPGASRYKDDQGFWHDSPRTCMPSSQIACGQD